MCEINPKHSKVLRLEFFTSQQLTPEQWETKVATIALEMEMQANADGSIRCHIHDETPTKRQDEAKRLLAELWERVTGATINFGDFSDIEPEINEFFGIEPENPRETKGDLDFHNDREEGRA